MNARQKKKRDRKLFTAVKELNDDIANSDNLEPIPDHEYWELVEKLKTIPGAVQEAFSHHSEMKKRSEGR